MGKFMRVLFLFFVLTITLIGCLPNPGKVAGDVVTEYHALITAYQDAQATAASSKSCLALTFSEITAQTTIMNNYLTADVAKAKAYRETLANYGGKFNDQSQAFAAAKDQSGNLDLAKLLASRATPADMALTIQAYVTSFQEAPLERVDPTVSVNTQRLVSEKYNQSFACVKDWNDVVRRYNVERNKIPGDVVGRIAEYLKVKELPQQLPYFEMEVPTGPPVVPTVSVGQ